MRTLCVLFYVSFLTIALTAQTRQIGTPAGGQEYTTFQNLADSVWVEWIATFHGRGSYFGMYGSENAQANDIAVDKSGNVYVTGQSYGPDSIYYDYITIKYNSSGTEEWVATYDGTKHQDDRANAIAVDNLGNVYVTGQSDGVGVYWDYVTIKYNASGEEQWVARYSGPGGSEDIAWDIAVDDKGSVYVTGESPLIADWTKPDFCTIKYDTDGTELWLSRYKGTSGTTDKAYALALDDSGYVYVTGQINNLNSGFDYGTVKYNGSTGAEEWVAYYSAESGNYSEFATAMAVDSSCVCVTGRSWNPGNSYDYATIKYDLSSGTELWATSYNGPVNDHDKANAITLDGSGNVYVTGQSYGMNNFDYATVRYNGSTGAEEWAARYDGSGNGCDVANDIAVDNSGNVYVTGRSGGVDPNYPRFAVDFVTIKYDELTGAEKWIAKYNGENDSTESANALALDDSGNVYVTGWSLLSMLYQNLVTIKYNQDGVSAVESKNYQPGDFGLYQNYPNPFNPSTVIEYVIPENGFVNLDVYNLLGEKVAALVNEIQSAGRYKIQFDASELSSGVYIYSLKSGSFTSIKKMMLLR